MTDFIDWGEKHPDCMNIPLDDIKKYSGDLVGFSPEQRSSQLYNLLVQKTKGEALRIVTNVVTKEGLSAWNKLMKRYTLVTARGRRSILQRLLNPRPAKTLQEVLEVQEKWESDRHKYEETATAPLPLARSMRATHQVAENRSHIWRW